VSAAADRARCLLVARDLRELRGISDATVRNELAVSDRTAAAWARLSERERDAVIACSREWAA
jgi:hypothetical protein